MYSLSRRRFTLGSLALASLGVSTSGAVAATGTRSVTTSLGTYDIPADPRRIVAIDSRLDLQPALALGLPVIGYAHSVPGDWVPVDPAAEFFGSIVNIEQVLAAEPDLIICADYNPDSEYWPLNRLRPIAPLLPTKGDDIWQTQLRALATLLDRNGRGDEAIAEYDSLVADVRARHADKLAERIVVSVQPDAGGLWPMNGSTTLHTQVLGDLGARTIPPAILQKYEAEKVTSENFLSVFGDVSGFLLATTGTEEIAMLDAEPLWQRLDAVSSGAVVASNGNVNYGSVYSAMHLVRLFDGLYEQMS